MASSKARCPKRHRKERTNFGIFRHAIAIVNAWSWALQPMTTWRRKRHFDFGPGWFCFGH